MTPSLQLTAIELRVSALQRSLDFYVRQVRFVILRDSPGRVELGTASTAAALLTLVEDRAAQPPSADAAGLFHSALLFPKRGALGRWLRFAAERQVRFDGF